MTVDDGWLAGIIEGEAHVGRDRKRLRVVVKMTDSDVVQRVAQLWGASVRGPFEGNRPNRKPLYSTSIYGQRAQLVMQHLRPLLGQRRRAQVDAVPPIAQAQLRGPCPILGRRASS